MKPKFYILPVIIISQFFCTSLWFAGNAVIDDLATQFNAEFNILGYLLSFVQFGFIIGTLTFALLTLADRFSPSRIFMICAFLGGLSNLSLLIPNITVFNLLTARFGTGFFLAGIYPIGMKIASDYYKDGLGRALGYIVGALVLGTAFPHLINEFSWSSDYKAVIISTSILAFTGGLSMWFLVPDGPYRKLVSKLQLGIVTQLFGIPSFRKAAFGYFGHMWELYAFWGFIPIILKTYSDLQSIQLQVSFWSFIIIGIGAISCILGGLVSLKTGSRKVAYNSLLISGVFCIASPLLFKLPPELFLTALSIWSMLVISDSPQFSTMVAAAAPPELKGTGLTITNCIGFAITILSIQLLSFLTGKIDNTMLYLFLSIGPIFGLYALRK
ncbi:MULTISPECIES: MFS transporter [Aquimarina]|uniref:MFS transporter n=1 Tax=Aquimarina algiphila TaxID=2047982 RepID=A0A554VFZ7_9FLAO|nr:MULTISPECIES: MFS transporter [Aquimarina]TSE06243.1 MFS transporter [Aquimarina algiphila]